MKSFIRKILQNKSVAFLDQLLFRINDDGVLAIGAQLTYFIILSVFPFIVVFFNILSYTPLVREDVLIHLIKYMPLDVQTLITGFVNEIVRASSQSLLSFAAVFGIWSASSGITAVMRAISKAYDYEETRPYYKIKLISIIFTIILLILLVVVFLTLVLGELIGNKLFSYFGLKHIFSNLWSFLRIIIPLLYMILTFALFYKYAPCVDNRKDIKLRSPLPGAIFTTLGWIIASTLFSYYVNNFGRYTITYGSLGGIIILLIWLYLSSIIIVLGGEINATIEYFRIHGYENITDKSILKKFI